MENLEENKTSNVISDWNDEKKVSSARCPKRQKGLKRTQRRTLFFAGMVAVPILLFIVFYCIVNIDSIFLAFKTYTLDTEKVEYVEKFVWFDNFKVVFKMLGHGDNIKMVTNSLLLWAMKLVVGLPISIIFSYYIYKKCLGGGFFRVILFLPNVIANLIMVYLFRLFANNGVVELFRLKAGMGLLDNPQTDLWTIIFFNLWLGFAGQTLMFTSTMSGINESVVESAHLDGVNSLNELWYITIPMIYPTFTTFVVLGIAEIFTDQMSMMSFRDGLELAESRLQTVGYYLYWQSLNSDLTASKGLWSEANSRGYLSYTQLSAFGVLISVIIVPISLLTKKLLDKIGPNAE